jgi:hypothetical protein
MKLPNKIKACIAATVAVFALASLQPAQAVLPNIFATTPAGNVAASTLDQNFTFLESQGVQAVTTTGSSNAYIAAPSDAWTGSYSSYTGRALTIKPNFTNTGAATLNVSGLGNASFYKNIGGVSTALASGDIVSGIPAIVISDGTNFLLTNPTSNFTLSPTFRNPLINGDMSVNQRNTTFTSINGFATPTHTIDGWFGWTDSTAAMTVSQQAGAISGTGFNDVLRVQRPNTNTSTNAHRVGQVILTADALKFAGQSATLSFYARSGAGFSGASGNILVLVGQGTGSDQGSSSYTNATWTGQTNALSTTQTITSSMTRYSVAVSFTSTTKEIAVTFGFTPVGTAGASDYFEITGVQLELGGVATGYEYIPYDVGFNRCQFFLPGFNGVTTYGIGQNTSATVSFPYVQFPRAARTAPTGIINSTVGNFSVTSNVGGGVALTALAISAPVGTTGALMQATVAAGLAAGNATVLSNSNASAQLLFTGAEL